MAAHRPTGFLWVLLLLPLFSQCATQESYYYVKPTTDTSCPTESDHCLTLSEYVQQSDEYLTSNATMVFLPGTHTLDDHFHVHNITTFRLLGNSTLPPQVVCSSPLCFTFDGLQLLEISNLAITGHSSISFYNCIICVTSVQHFQLNYCSLLNNVEGALRVETCSYVSIMNTSFVNNSASLYGGGVNALHSTVIIEHSSFVENSAKRYGGAINADHSNLYLNGSNFFEWNEAGEEGGAIDAYYSYVRLYGSNFFGKNQAYRNGGAIDAYYSYISLDGANYFERNQARQGGAIHNVPESAIIVTGNVTFLHNYASRGGGLSQDYSSKVSFLQGAVVLFEGNSADYGAAINVDDVPECLTNSNIIRSSCFFSLPSMHLPQLTFVNNLAKERGSVLYGGQLYGCSEGSEIFSNVSKLNNNTIPTISSEQFQVCFCWNKKPNCSYSLTQVETFRGQMFSVCLAILDQVMQPIPGIIRAVFHLFSGTNATIPGFPNIKSIGETCTDLQYTIFSQDAAGELILYAEGPCGDMGILSQSINVTFRDCPDGFFLSQTECVCEKRLREFTKICNVTDQTVQRSGEFWFHLLYSNGTYEGLILHPHCPFDYCEDKTVDIPINNTDVQCTHGRSGILCGSCQSGLSIALGSSHCLANCSDAYLALILPFAALGILLVIVILLLKLTVAIGTINGLIFYADIIAANRTIFFPHEHDTNILTVFISWLNLDLGIETCFYNGMDTYAKTWLQFIFPFYLWILVGLIIIASHFSTKISKLLGSNPVAVLATLFLLSYAKILSIVVAALSFTLLEYPNETRTVWFYDGNIRYFHEQHIPLVLFALLVLLLLFLPYTLFLFLHQWLQMKSDNRFLKWVTKPQVKAFMDAYHAPYMPKQRYWTGLLLILRCALWLVFAFNALRDPNVNLLVIATSTFGIAVIVWLTGRVYKNWWLDALESSFILNLGVLAVGTSYIKLAGGNQAALVYTLVSIAFATFIGIVLYHIYFQLKNTKTSKHLLESSTSFFHGIWAKITLENSMDKQSQENGKGLTNDSSVTCTSSYVELRELLLDESDTVPIPPPHHD